jgi:hypothetical protein
MVRSSFGGRFLRTSPKHHLGGGVLRLPVGGDAQVGVTVGGAPQATSRSVSALDRNSKGGSGRSGSCHGPSAYGTLSGMPSRMPGMVPSDIAMSLNLS